MPTERVGAVRFALRMTLLVVMLLLTYWIGEPGSFFMYQGF
jgi:hypothetical protein